MSRRILRFAINDFERAVPELAPEVVRVRERNLSRHLISIKSTPTLLDRTAAADQQPAPAGAREAGLRESERARARVDWAWVGGWRGPAAAQLRKRRRDSVSMRASAVLSSCRAGHRIEARIPVPSLPPSLHARVDWVRVFPQDPQAATPALPTAPPTTPAPRGCCHPRSRPVSREPLRLAGYIILYIYIYIYYVYIGETPPPTARIAGPTVEAVGRERRAGMSLHR